MARAKHAINLEPGDTITVRPGKTLTVSATTTRRDEHGGVVIHTHEGGDVLAAPALAVTIEQDRAP